MTSEALASIVARVRPAQRALEIAWQRDLADPAAGALLMEVLDRYNEEADAALPALARAVGVSLAELRERYTPRSRYQAMFDGSVTEFIESLETAPTPGVTPRGRGMPALGDPSLDH